MLESKTITFPASSDLVSLKTSYEFFKYVITAQSAEISNLAKSSPSDAEGEISYILKTGKDFIYRTEPIPLKAGVSDHYRKEEDDILIRDILVTAPAGARVTFKIAMPDSFR